MCMGGGGGGGTIQKPDYAAYDRQFDLQKSAIDKTMSNGMLAMQTELQGVLRDQTKLRERIADAKEHKAESQEALEAEARRLSVLVGPPPPEETAQAPEVGSRERNLNTRKGKGALRISRKQASSTRQGTGLNIT